MASDALKFGDAMRAPLARSERVSIGRPLFVASPYGAHVGRFLPDCPVAERPPGLFLRCKLPGCSRRGYRRGAEEHEPGDIFAPRMPARGSPAKPVRRRSACNQPAPTRLTPMEDSLPARLESGFPGGIVAGGLPRIRSIPWPPVRTGKAFCAFRW